MQTRRSFFKRMTAASAILALAPKIAFSRELEPIFVEQDFQREFVEALFFNKPIETANIIVPANGFYDFCLEQSKQSA